MDINILDSLLYNFESIFIGSMGQVKGYAIGLLQLLMMIDFILAILLNLGDEDHIKTYIKKLLKYGVWIYFVQNWGMIINVILQSFILVGIAAGGSGIGLDLIKSPSTICTEGLRLIYPLIEYLTQFKGFIAIFENPWIILLTAISILVILIAFIIIAIQIFITYVEFYITATQLLIFVPFGTNKFTSFLAEKAIGGIFAYGVKFMVLTSILAAIGPIVRAWSVTATETPTPAILMGTMAACLLIAFLCWHVPGMAAGIMTGAPSLTAGNVASTGVAAGAVVAGAAMAGSAAVGALGGLGLGSSSALPAATGTAGSAASPLSLAANAASAIPRLSSGNAPRMLSGGSSASSTTEKPQIPLLPSGSSSGFSENTASSSTASSYSTETPDGTGFAAQASNQSASTFSETQTGTASFSADTPRSGAGSAQYYTGAAPSSPTHASSPQKTIEKTQFASAAASYRPSISSGMIVSQAQRAVPPAATPKGSFQFPLKSD